MLKAKNKNRVVRIADEKMAAYKALGYTIMDMNGKVIYEPENTKAKIAALEKENAELKAAAAEIAEAEAGTEAATAETVEAEAPAKATKKATKKTAAE